jgi:hypothetical protein
VLSTFENWFKTSRQVHRSCVFVVACTFGINYWITSPYIFYVYTIVVVCFIGGGNRSTRRKPLTTFSIWYCIDYRAEFDLATSMVRDTDCTGGCHFNYNTTLWYLPTSLKHSATQYQFWYVLNIERLQGVITVFTVFRLLTDFVCLYNYEFWLSLCKIVRSSVILLLPLFMYLLAISKIFANRIKMLSTLVVVAHSAPSTIMINL